MTQAHNFAFVANAAAREVSGAAKQVALAAGQAVAVAHVAAHELGAAACAIKAAREVALDGQAEKAGRLECEWQRAQLPSEIRDLVLYDQSCATKFVRIRLLTAQRRNGDTKLGDCGTRI